LLALLAILLAGSLTAPFRPHAIASPAAGRPVVDTARFVAQVGGAAFAFYQWVYKPYTNHAFDKGANGRAAAISKAAASLALSAASLKSAYDLAKKSDSKALQALGPALDKLQQQADAATTKLKDAAAAKKQDAIAKAQTAAATYLPQLKQSFDAFLQQAKAKGVNIKPVQPKNSQ
jgi:hypothetical protein